MTPNEALWGYQPTLYPAQPRETTNDLAETWMETLHQKWAQAIAAIDHTENHLYHIQNVFRIDDQVWLESKHLNLPHQSKKLAPKHVGPFRITWVVSPVAFQLELPLSWRIHNVFHASLLMPYQETPTHGPNFSKPPPNLIEGEKEFEVEAIINHCEYGHWH